jgi:signal transduction histidine kinase
VEGKAHRKDVAMPTRKAYRPATAILFGVSTISIFLILATMWNILLVYDVSNSELRTGQTATGHWVVLIIGYVLFVLTAFGIVYLFVLLLAQIKANQQQQNFIDSVSHELRSPLTSIKLHLETLQRRSLPEATRTEFVGLMLGDVSRLNRLIEQILEAARRDQPQRHLEREPTHLHAVAEQVAAEMTVHHRLSAANLTVEGPALTLWTRPTDLHLILTNLIDNAIKYSDPPVQVRIDWQVVAGDNVEIRVSDQGIGIPKSLQRRVFHRFVRGTGDAARSRKGTGLGLYIVKETVKSLRGRVSLQSSGDGQGTTFTVRLPIGTGEMDDHGEHPAG